MLIHIFGVTAFTELCFSTVVPNLWYAYPWRYAAVRLGVRENIGKAI
jgi:hypothetical protein